MPSRLKITRRDFLGGVALAATSGALAPRELFAQAATQGAAAGISPLYPPALTGLRGSQPGSYDVAHAVAWAGKRYPTPREIDESDYDLVVVGGGLSGLAAAFYWRQEKGPDAKILILDNHDDFGGHARRNEFTVDGKRLVGYGGSQSIDTPGSYSADATQLLRDVGVFTERFYDYFDQDYHQRLGLERGFFFARENYGRDVTAPAFNTWRSGERGALTADQIASYPLDERAKAALLALMNEDRNYLADMPREARPRWLQQRSYGDYLMKTVGVPADVYYLFRDAIRGWWGVGWDAVSALEAYRMGMPGTAALDLPPLETKEPERDEPYIFHFPDGNAGVAKAILRKLIPDAIPGSTMEDLALATTDYSLLDRPGASCRLRLNSTAVDVRNSADRKTVDLTYVHNGRVRRLRARHAIMACYNAILPHICPELPEDQREAIAYAEKVPLIYVSVAMHNWRPFAELGMHQIAAVQPAFMHSFGLDFPVSMGGVEFPQNPEQPMILHGSAVPCAPDQGMTAREQHLAGRRYVYGLSWDEMEGKIVHQLEGALGGVGFDPERDIAGITANRWPHGYAYEYNDLSDPPEYGRENGPHVLGARQLGRISIANSDASAYAFVDGAFDAARRASREQLS